MKGRIIKNQNGYFSILGESGKLHLCRSRGKLKRATNVLVGDEVEYEIPAASQDAMITRVYPRKSVLHRPLVANIDLLILTSAVCSPDVNVHVLDKMILMAESMRIAVMLCFNKIDLDPKKTETLRRMYEKAGYSVVCTSTINGAGLEQLSSSFHGHIIAFSGPSGAGKSSLINRILGKEILESGNVSTRTGRGKNTTRHAEIIPCDGGRFFLMDTPGFTSLELNNIPPEHLDGLFPDFIPFIGNCRFTDCRHINEPECAIRDAVTKGEIQQFRYQSYCQALAELKENRSKY